MCVSSSDRAAVPWLGYILLPLKRIRGKITWEFAARGVALGSMEEGAAIFLEPFSKRPYVLSVPNGQGSVWR